jgi:hypothetical protein
MPDIIVSRRHAMRILGSEHKLIAKAKMNGG